jgi:hypothetical protein
LEEEINNYPKKKSTDHALGYVVSLVEKYLNMTLFLQLEIQLDNQNLQLEVLNFGGFIEEKKTTISSQTKCIVICVSIRHQSI